MNRWIFRSVLLSLVAAFAAVSGCGTDCSDVGAPMLYDYSFSVILRAPQGTYPADLQIVLKTKGTSESFGIAVISDSDAGPTAGTCVRDGGEIKCRWGDGEAGTGSFEATAAGFVPVRLDLEATSSCNQTSPDYQSVTLVPM
jgi:hypothetical protein